MLRKSAKLAKISRSLKELKQLSGNTKISDGSYLGKHLGSIYRRVNRRSEFSAIFLGTHKRMPKKDFVQILQRLTENYGLCPEGSTYSTGKIVRIIRGFHDNPQYRIPEAIYKTADWLQVSMVEYIRRYRSYEQNTKESRMAGIKRHKEIRRLYEGLAPESNNI